MNRSYWISVAQVSGGVVVGQLIGMIGFMLLAWVYRPAEFGNYATWLAISSVGSVAGTGAIETSLVRDEDGAPRSEAAAKIIGTAIIGAALTTLGCLITLILMPWVLPGDKALAALAIGAGVFGISGNVVYQSWAAAEGRFKALTLMRIAQSSLIMFTPLLLSVFGRTSHHLIWGHILGLVASQLIWLSIFPTDTFGRIRFHVLLSFWRERARCFKIVLPALLIGSLAGNLPQLVVNARFGADAAGFLALAQRVLGVPLSVVGMAVRDVFKRHASVAFRSRGECVREFWNTFLVLAAVAVAFVLVMLPLSEVLFVLVFGEVWRFAGIVASWLLVMFAIGIVASPLTYLVFIAGREEFDLFWQTTLLIVIAISLFAFGDLETTLKVFAWTYSTMYVLFIIACARFARGSTFVTPV